MTQGTSAKELDEMVERLNDFLSKKGFKRTKQRDLIARTIFEAGEHLDANAIYQRVREKDLNLGYSTVYRTVRLLTDFGLVNQRNFGDAGARYEAAHEGEHHDHLICVSCGKIVEFESEEIERIQEQIASSHGFVVESHNHELYGRCAECRKR